MMLLIVRCCITDYDTNRLSAYRAGAPPIKYPRVQLIARTSTIHGRIAAARDGDRSSETLRDSDDAVSSDIMFGLPSHREI